MPAAEPALILASASARRAELLRSADVSFCVVPAKIEELLRDGESPADFAQRMAREKSTAVRRQRGAVGDLRPVLGADTIVVVDGSALGKPADRTEARSMISLLSGRAHQVITAICLLAESYEHEQSVTTDVRFRELEEPEIERYLDRAAWHDKAGAYAIQAEAGYMVHAINGSYSNVVGLPLCETVTALTRALPAKSAAGRGP